LEEEEVDSAIAVPVARVGRVVSLAILPTLLAAAYLEQLVVAS